MRIAAALLTLGCALGVAASPARAQNVDLGPTFDAIDATVSYVSIWFGDVKSTSIRRPDGAIESIVEDAQGRVLARSYHRDGYLAASLAAPGEPRQVAGRLARRSYATDWFARHLETTWRQHDGELRGSPAAAREPVAVRTQFRDHFAYGVVTPAGKRKAGAAYPKFTTVFYDNQGQQLGLIRYYDKPKAVSWSFKNTQEGVAPYWRVPGGFKFEPDMAWAGVQAMAFQQTRNPDGSKRVRASRAAAVASPGLFERISHAWAKLADTIVPPLHAQSSDCDGLSDGCTGLHWLDDSIFRDCCDTHDQCFEVNCQDPCTKWSWIWPFGNWHCAGCNVMAVVCFVTKPITSGGDPNAPPPPMGGSACYDNDPCTRCSPGDWCPAECQTCDGIGSST
jgi:hypothetical protein